MAERRQLSQNPGCKIVKFLEILRFSKFSVMYTKTVRVFRILEVYTTGPFSLFRIFELYTTGFQNLSCWCIHFCLFSVYTTLLKFLDFFRKFCEICRSGGPLGGWRRRGFRICHGRRPTALVTWQGRRSEAEGVRGSGGWAILARLGIVGRFRFKFW